MSSFYKKNLIGLLYYDPIANVCILQDPTLFYSVSFYSVSFSCTAQIHKLKFKSEYYLRINETIESFYSLTVMIVPQKYQELSLQVEISE